MYVIDKAKDSKSGNNVNLLAHFGTYFAKHVRYDRFRLYLSITYKHVHYCRSCSVIVRVRVVLKRTVVGDSDSRFDNLSGSHHQSQVKVLFVSRML